MKNDKYSQARGGWSRILEITCEKCSGYVCLYQKDGSGPLKRMYVDRIIGFKPTASKLVCSNCGNVLGLKTTYAKENRQAYRLFQSSVNKKMVKRATAK